MWCGDALLLACVCPAVVLVGAWLVCDGSVTTGAMARARKRQCAQWDPHMRMCAAFL